MAVKSRALKPPVGGWDARNALADMPEENAVILENWFPSTDKLTLRRGFSEHATGMSGPVESLMAYTPQTGTSQLFAANGGSIYNVGAAGAVGAAVVTGMSNNRWQHVQIGTAGGHFLMAMNGVDEPRLYDGATWSVTAITGPTETSLVWCNLHQRRLWFGEVQSLSAWYLPVNSVGGTASEFALAAVARLGGYIMAMGTWTRDGGDGVDDVAVFVTSEGEAVVYQGIDPATAADWQLVGVFRIGRPIGRRCLMKAGADLIIITEDGFVAASTILAADRSQTGRVAISAQIDQAVNDAVRDHGSQFGWEPFIYPKGTMLLFNVPQSATTANQFVFNTLTNAPCRFKGINAKCWALREDTPYFGGEDGKVYLFDFGSSDNGTAIVGDCVQAFNYLGSKTSQKAMKRIEVLLQSGGDPTASVGLDLDFVIRATPLTTIEVATDAAKWGEGLWGTDKWGSAGQIYPGWRGVRGIARAVAPRVRVETSTAQPSWLATNVLYMVGGPI